jgi:hypothetical protein
MTTTDVRIYLTCLMYAYLVLHVSTYNYGHHQAPLIITQVIKIKGHNMDSYTCN